MAEIRFAPNQRYSDYLNQCQNEWHNGGSVRIVSSGTMRVMGNINNITNRYRTTQYGQVFPRSNQRFSENGNPKIAPAGRRASTWKLDDRINILNYDYFNRQITKYKLIVGDSTPVYMNQNPINYENLTNHDISKMSRFLLQIDSGSSMLNSLICSLGWEYPKLENQIVKISTGTINHHSFAHNYNDVQSDMLFNLFANNSVILLDIDKININIYRQKEGGYHVAFLHICGTNNIVFVKIKDGVWIDPYRDYRNFVYTLIQDKNATNVVCFEGDSEKRIHASHGTFINHTCISEWDHRYLPLKAYS